MTTSLTVARLRELLHYDPLTGVFTRLTRAAKCCQIGDIAGNVDKTTGYHRIRIDGRLYRSHLLAWLYVTGNFPDSQVDHRDGVRHNNAWKNLRKATRLQNNQNKSVYKNNKSGVAGVRWNSQCNKWQAHVKQNGKYIYLGMFEDINDAIAARRSGEQKYYGDFARSA